MALSILQMTAVTLVSDDLLFEKVKGQDMPVVVGS